VLAPLNVLKDSPPPTLPFPSVIDSTMLTTWACPRKFYWEWVERIRPAGDSIHLHAGAAFAKGLEAARLAFYRDGKSMAYAEEYGLYELTKVYGNREPANTTPTERSKAWPRIVDAYLTYLERYPFDKDSFKVALFSDKPTIEFSFALDSEVMHPTTGDPIILGGRFDWIANQFGTLWGVDEKTGRALKVTAYQDVNLWYLRAQLLCYAYAAHRYGYNVVGILVREIAVQLENIKLGESLVYAEPWRRERWWQWANARIRSMVAAWKLGNLYPAIDKRPVEDAYEQNFGDLCTTWGGCAYAKLCAVQNPHDWKKLGYVPNTWNPLERQT
jgi:hypothetical protein